MRACSSPSWPRPAWGSRASPPSSHGAVSDRATVLIGQTPSYGDGVTFAPLVELLSQAAGRPGGDAESVASALRERLATQPDGPAVGDRIAQVLGVGEALASDASWAVRRVLEVLASERPLVVVLEDLHWAEPPMLDLADSVVERVHGPVLFLCLARPELLEQRPTWASGKPRAITTTLPPLSTEDARRVAELLLGPQAPGPVVDRVCQTAEGNPLYLEQLTAMLADQGLLVDGRWVGSDEADVEIPATLQALLAARLDRLEPVPRLILERASVEGRRFRIAALGALVPDLEPRRRRGCDRLTGTPRSRAAGGRGPRSVALRARARPRGRVPRPLEGAAGGSTRAARRLDDRGGRRPGRRRRVGRAAPRARAASAGRAWRA